MLRFPMEFTLLLMVSPSLLEARLPSTPLKCYNGSISVLQNSDWRACAIVVEFHSATNYTVIQRYATSPRSPIQTLQKHCILLVSEEQVARSRYQQCHCRINNCNKNVVVLRVEDEYLNEKIENYSDTWNDYKAGWKSLNESLRMNMMRMPNTSTYLSMIKNHTGLFYSTESRLNTASNATLAGCDYLSFWISGGNSSHNHNCSVFSLLGAEVTVSDRHGKKQNSNWAAGEAYAFNCLVVMLICATVVLSAYYVNNYRRRPIKWNKLTNQNV